MGFGLASSSVTTRGKRTESGNSEIRKPTGHVSHQGWVWVSDRLGGLLANWGRRFGGCVDCVGWVGLQEEERKGGLGRLGSLPK
jgi:hypothetical protein